MSILITGSKGLIGSALKQALEILNIEVKGLDNRFGLDDPEYGDILDEKLLSSVAESVSGIVHLAAVSRVIDGEKKPKLCWTTNVEGTRNVVNAAFSSKKRPWVLYASSREVYGNQKDFPVKESACLSPVNIYGESKMEAEKVIGYAAQKGLTTSIVRFSNVFGSVHDHHDRVIPAFCRAAVEKKDIRCNGKDNLFDFTYLEDVIQGLLSLIFLISKTDESLPPVHLASGIPMNLGQIAAIAQCASHYPVNVVEGISRSFDVSKFWGDTDLAKRMLKWKACVSVEEGIHRLINQYRLFFRIKNDQLNFNVGRTGQRASLNTALL